MATEDKSEDAFNSLVMFVLSLLCMPASIVLWGWVLQHSWNWFAPVVDARLPAITLGQAVATRAVVGIFTVPLGTLAAEKTTKQRLAATLVMTFIAPFMTMLFQWILHLFVHV